MSASVDVLAVLRETAIGLHGVADECINSELAIVMGQRARAMDAAVAAVAKLIEADQEYDASLSGLKAVTRRVETQGWVELEFDALRKAGDRFVRAQMRRAEAHAHVGGPT